MSELSNHTSPVAKEVVPSLCSVGSVALVWKSVVKLTHVVPLCSSKSTLLVLMSASYHNVAFAVSPTGSVALGVLAAKETFQLLVVPAFKFKSLKLTHAAFEPSVSLMSLPLVLVNVTTPALFDTVTWSANVVVTLADDSAD